jgi:hypothetical protein
MKAYEEIKGWLRAFLTYAPNSFLCGEIVPGAHWMGPVDKELF